MWLSKDASSLCSSKLDYARAHLFQLTLLIRAIRRELLLRNLLLRLYLRNALPKHALLVCPQR